MSNRRRSERYDVSIPIQIKGSRGAEMTLTANVSAHGIAVFTDRTLPLRQYVELELTLPPSATKVNATAMVVRNSERLVDRAGLTHPGIAFDFYLFDAVGRAAWWAYIDRLKAGASPQAPGAQVSLPAPKPGAAEPETATTFLINPGDIARLWAFFRTELSQGSVRIESPTIKPPGTKVELLVVHPNTDGEWILLGEVRAASQHGRGRGPMIEIRLAPIDRDQREGFRQFIQTGKGVELPVVPQAPETPETPAAAVATQPARQRSPTFAAFFAEAQLQKKVTEDE